MINGNLTVTNHVTTSIQVVIVQSEEGGQLSLKDTNGTYLVTPSLPILSPTPNQKDDEQRAQSFMTEMN